MLTTIFYTLLALDQTVAQLAAQYGHWLYGLLFLVIFAATLIQRRLFEGREPTTA